MISVKFKRKEYKKNYVGSPSVIIIIIIIFIIIIVLIIIISKVILQETFQQ